MVHKSENASDQIRDTTFPAEYAKRQTSVQPPEEDLANALAKHQRSIRRVLRKLGSHEFTREQLNEMMQPVPRRTVCDVYLTLYSIGVIQEVTANVYYIDWRRYLGERFYDHARYTADKVWESLRPEKPLRFRQIVDEVIASASRDHRDLGKGVSTRVAAILQCWCRLGAIEQNLGKGRARYYQAREHGARARPKFMD